MLAEQPPVVAEEDDDGVGRQPKPVQRVEHAAHLRVHEAHAGIVGTDELTQLVLRQAVVRHGQQACGGGDFRKLLQRRGREAELVHRMQVKEVFARDRRHMRPEKTAADEEGLLRPRGVPLQQLDDFSGNEAVRVVGAVARRGVPREGRAETELGREVPERSFLRLVAPAGVDGAVPRRRVVVTFGANAGRHVVMKQLAGAHHGIARPHECLRQRLRVRDGLAEVPGVFEDADGVWPQPGQERRTRRAADRILAIRAVEPHALRGEPV